MSKQQSPTLSAARLARLLAALPLAAALACTDDVSPVAPPATAASPIAEVSAGAYPGTTNTEFSSVQRQVLSDRISLYFKYSGVVTPSLTVGTTTSVFGGQAGSAAAKNQNNGYWSVTVAGLKPGTKYWYRLDNLKSTWYDSARTHRRDLTVDLDSIRVIYDGDPGPNCGEIYADTRAVEIVKSGLDQWGNPDYDEMYEHQGFTQIHSMCSGSTFVFAKNADGHEVFEDFRGDYVGLRFKALDIDSCTKFQAGCGDVGYTNQKTLLVPKTGSVNFAQTTAKYQTLQLVFYGRVSVNYVPWPWS